MTPTPAPDAEPRPLARPVPFEEGDFHALGSDLRADPQYDDRRLVLRRKLGALGKVAVADLKASCGLDLLSRTSLHRPTPFNRGHVRRIWVYLCRSKRQKTKLRRTLGSELAKDLDAAYRNAYLCIAVEAEALEVAFRIHPEAWYDGQNLKNRLEREGLDGGLEVLRALRGYRLRMADWKGEWELADLDRDRLGEFLGFWTPGEHGLAVFRRWPAPPGARAALFEPDVPDELLKELARLAPLYRYAVWSDESDFLFGG